MRRQRNGYFERTDEMPKAIMISLKRRVNFNEIDIMGIVWHGHYARLFEEASAELGRKCGFSYGEYRTSGIQAPIVQLHVDYHVPLLLEELCQIEAFLIWSEGARLHTEFRVTKEDGVLAATGYTIQLYIDATSKEVLFASPDFLERCRREWLEGRYHGESSV